MSYFAVTREAGPAWSDGGIAAQPGVADHAAFMDGLADAGFVLAAGPLDGTEQGQLRALLIVAAADEAEIHARLAGDPWVNRLRTVAIEPWNVFVGASRLGSPAA